MTLSALVLHKDDNVATTLRPLKTGDTVGVEIEDSTVRVVILQSIPFGHKFALKDIECGEKVIKYGEIIGQAMVRIPEGEHVHVHNVEGLRGRGDRA